MKVCGREGCNKEVVRVWPASHKQYCSNKCLRLVSAERRRLKVMAERGVEDTTADSGACELCGKICKRLCYDHDHSTGRHRGWLCVTCNVSLEWLLNLGTEGSKKIEEYLNRRQHENRN
jgi:hypothetical protein